MTFQKIVFKKPVSILQVYRNINVYGKDKRSFDSRREDTLWREFSTKSGFVSEGELFLPESVLSHSKFPDCDLLTLEDSLNSENSGINNCFHLHHSNPLYIFRLKQEEELVLYLNYDDFAVGIPKRDDFKICELRMNTPVEIKINGKTDFSMTSGRARIFKEQFFIFEYLGNFNSCQILKNPFFPHIKEVPRDRKLVDLLKPLW